MCGTMCMVLCGCVYVCPGVCECVHMYMCALCALVVRTGHGLVSWRAGEKVLLRWYRGYLIVVATGGKMSRQVSSSVPGAKDPMTICIYDVQNKFAGKEPHLCYIAVPF